jgi:hypothetical protein
LRRRNSTSTFRRNGNFKPAPSLIGEKYFREDSRGRFGAGLLTGCRVGVHARKRIRHFDQHFLKEAASKI